MAAVYLDLRRRHAWLDDSGKLSHGEITLGDSLIMLSTPTPHYQSPRHHRQVCKEAARRNEVPYVIDGVLVFVDDIEKHFIHAKENGATDSVDRGNGWP